MYKESAGKICKKLYRNFGEITENFLKNKTLVGNITLNFKMWKDKNCKISRKFWKILKRLNNFLENFDKIYTDFVGNL